MACFRFSVFLQLSGGWINFSKIENSGKNEFRKLYRFLEINAITLAESQAVGLPAVARPIGAVAEKITNGITGYITLDEVQFSEYVFRLLNDDNLMIRMSNDAKNSKRVKSWKTVVKELQSIISWEYFL